MQIYRAKFVLLAAITIIAPTARGATETSDLKLVITVEQPTITSPLPARVTLHLHNSGRETLWLYRKASAVKPAAGQAGQETPETVFGRIPKPVEGATVAVRLESEESQVTLPGHGDILDYVGLPQPKLIRLAAGEDYEEKAVIRLAPASVESAGANRPIWGRYKFSVTYAAQYSNGDDLNRVLGLNIWQGKVETNSIELELQPPPAASVGSMSGTVVNASSSPIWDVLVSLSDRGEKLLDQTRTNQQGQYSFTRLPPEWYWATVRVTQATEDTVVFRHLVLSPSEPAGTIDFLVPTPETYEPKQMLHKPVLFRIVDRTGLPLNNVVMDITWSSGTVMDSVKARTLDDGTAAVELIPGRCYVTLMRKGCPKDDERMDVAPGPGIDGFKMIFTCSKQ